MTLAIVGLTAAVGCGAVGPSAASVTRTSAPPIDTSAARATHFVRHEHASFPRRLIFHTEFNGPAGSQPSPSQWQVLTGPASNQELENYTQQRSNISDDGHGHLAMTARIQKTSAGGHEFRYTSAKLQTLGRFQVRYGRIEARIKLPTGTGLWPAFWMLGNNFPSVGWPTAGELDIMEMQGSRPTRLVATVHGPAPPKPTGWQLNRFYYSKASLGDRFHVFGIAWSPNQIIWTIDGHAYGKVTRSELPSGDQWVFNRPYYIILDLAVGGYWVGPPNRSTRFPATMLVDWVRVYS